MPSDKPDSFQEKYDFAVGFKRQLSLNQLNTITFLLNKKGFKHLLIDDPKISRFTILFLRHDNPKEFLKEAEKHNFLKPKHSSTNDLSPKKSRLKQIISQKGAENLDPRVKDLETRARFTFSQRHHFIKQESLLHYKDEAQELSTSSLVSTPTKTSLGDTTSSLTPSASKMKSLLSSSQDMSRSKNMLGSSPENQEDFNIYLQLFTPSETCQVVWSLLNSIEVNKKDTSFLDTFNIKEEATMSKKKLIDILQDLKLLEFVRPLHKNSSNIGIKNTTTIKDYFGPKIAIYFEFMVFYTKWLVIPAVFGIIDQYFIFETRPHLKFWIDTIYCVLIMIWAVLFVRFWERKTNELRVRWGAYGSFFQIANTRYNFKGALRVNPITELPELYYCPNRKFFLYLLSALAHLPLFLLAIFVAAFYLNTKGHVISGHLIYFEGVATLSQPGELLSKRHWKMTILIGRVLLKFLLKHMNNKLSTMTTNWENHRTHTAYDNSLITKRFLFGIINNFTNLTYIAFWKLDLDALREELLTLYIIDELKKFASQTLLPLLHKKVRTKRVEKTSLYLSEDKKGNSERLLSHYIVNKVNEINRREFNAFKDYFDMVMQFGYITLFAVVFPFSAAISLLLNAVELRSSLLKLRHVLRRPVPESVNGIGAWLVTIKVMTYLSVVTNSILIANTAEFRTVAMGKVGQPKQELESEMLKAIFIVEHLMVGILFVIRKLIEKHPAWVKVYIKRNFERGNVLWEKTY